MPQPFTFYVPAAPIREHVEKLRKFGIGHRQLAKIANVSPVVIQTLMNGHSTTPGKMTTRITNGAAQRLLKIQSEHRHLAAGAMIDARGSQRRIQALCAQGYSLRWQAETIGTKYANYARILSNGKITKAMAARIDELTERYAYEPQTATDQHGKKAISIAKNHARRNGWVTAAAWDDIDKDKLPNGRLNHRHPNLQKRLSETAAGIANIYAKHERETAIAYLKDQGWTFTKIAKTLHMAPASVSRIYKTERQ